MKRLKIINTDGVGYNTRVVDAETGESIEGVYRVEITLDVKDAVICKLYLHSVALDLDTDAYSRLVDIIHPLPKSIGGLYVERDG